MFKTVWPLMKERSNRLSCRKRCAFVDLSSITSIMPVSVASVYCASKAFNAIFTLGLGSYLSNPTPISSKDLPTPIDFLSVQPGYVDTSMTVEEKQRVAKKRKEDLKFFMHPNKVAEGALGCLGRVSYTPGAKGHGIVYLIFSTVRGLLPAKYWTDFMGKKNPHTDISKC